MTLLYDPQLTLFERWNGLYTPHLTLFSRKIRKEKLLGSAYVTEINYIQLLETLQGLHYNPHLTVFLYTPNLTLISEAKEVPPTTFIKVTLLYEPQLTLFRGWSGL